VTIHDNDCNPGFSARLQSLRPNLNPPITFTGQPVTFTARLRPSNPPPGHGAFYWQARKLLGRDAQGLFHWGDWLPAPGTRTNNTLVTTQYTPWTGQYHVELVPCWSFLESREAVSIIAFQDPLKVTSVIWQQFSKPLVSNDHPTAPVGLKMYADRDSPTQAGLLLDKWVNIEATIQPAKARVPVYFKIFDVDDPSSQVGPIDPNGVQGDDNIGDPHTGSFPGEALNNQRDLCHTSIGFICKLTNSSGKATVTFQVTMQPGDNFRVAATVDEPKLGLLHVGNPTTAGFLEPNDNQVSAFTPHGAVSRMLTVWRRLWVEVDSMTAGPTIPSAARSPDNKLRSAAQGDTWLVSQPQAGQMTLNLTTSMGVPNDFYAGGYIESSDGTVRFEILSNTGAQIVVAGEGTISQRNKFIGQGTTYWVVDDDERITVAGFSPLLPRLNLINDQVKAKFKPAYIDLRDASQFNPRTLVPFRINSSSFPLVDAFNVVVEDDAKDLQDQPDFWAHLVVSGYQPSRSDDRDPNSEIMIPSETIPPYELSIIYLETLRDELQTLLPAVRGQQFSSSLYAAVAHEIGHAPKDQPEPEDHDEGELMGLGVHTIGEKFASPTLRRFRETIRWWR